MNVRGKNLYHFGNCLKYFCFSKELSSNFASNLSKLTHLFPIHPFSTSWKHQKTSGFSDVFRGWRKAALETSGLKWINLMNPFYIIGLFLWPQKTWENLRFVIVFRWYRRTPVVWNGLKLHIIAPAFIYVR